MSIVRSIVIPAYAEEAFIGSTLESLHAYLVAGEVLDGTEVIVVTAEATDKTQQITRESLAKFPHAQHIEPGPRVGKGRDVKAGMKAARGDQVLFMDADLATPLIHVQTAFELLNKNGGMVIGVRNLSSMHKTFSRKLTSRLSNTLIRLVVGWKIPDSQCGFKAFDRRTVDIILERSIIQGWGFDFEFIRIAKQHKIPVTTLPIPDWHDPKPEGTGLAGDSQLQAMKQTFGELLKVKRNSIKGLYK